MTKQKTTKESGPVSAAQESPAPAEKHAGAGAKTKELSEVSIYTDGGCSGNPGPGGWGALLISHGRRREMIGGSPESTNNRMELTAAIEALEALKRRCRVDLYTDSNYLRMGITEWIARWKRNGWRTAQRKPVKNVDLWQRLDAARERHDVRFHWVRGHAGEPENERAHELAQQGMAPYLRGHRGAE